MGSCKFPILKRLEGINTDYGNFYFKQIYTIQHYKGIKERKENVLFEIFEEINQEP